MALVGVIAAGDVDRILQSVALAGADVLVLFTAEGATGHVLFEKGEIVTARLGELRDDAAVVALKQWASGHYTLIKRDHAVEGTLGHVALGVAGSGARRSLARWLKHQGYQTSVIASPQQAFETITYLQPDLLLIPCPRGYLGGTCAELSERLRKEMRLPPAIIVVETGTPAHACPEPSPPCVRIAATVEALQQALAMGWTGTRLGVRQASMEQTDKIARPALPPQKRGGKSGSGEMLALALRGSLQSDRLTGRDLLLALAVLLAGSAGIWMAWWRGLLR